MKQIYLCLHKVLVFVLLLSVCSFGYAQTTYTVNQLGDVDDGLPGNGSTTLREAINLANGNAGADIIEFDFSALGGAKTITLTASLPTITEAVIIDGYSEPAAVQGPIGTRTINVEIDGNNAAVNGLTLNNTTGSIIISGLAIYNCTGNGILVSNGTDNVSIWGCNIGTNATGTATGLGNNLSGITVNSFGALNASNNIIIGTNGDNTTDANEGNVIAGNGSGGITDGGIVLFFTTNSVVAGNYCGLGSNGTTAIGNNTAALVLSDRCTNNTVGTNGDGVNDALERNYFSASIQKGIWIIAQSNNNIVAGNVCGLNITGAAAGNIGYGLHIDNASGNRIGTDANGTSDALEANYISSNISGGILISSGNLGGSSQNANGNIIAGNRIGVALDGTTARGNSTSGISIQADFAFQTSNNIIGSNGDGTNDNLEGNLIANNNGDGIVLGNAGLNAVNIAGNRISRNSIFSNGGLGINIIPGVDETATGGVTKNDDGDGDTGPNGVFNFPVISNVSETVTTITFEGFTRPGSIVEFYTASTGPNPNPLPGGFTRSFGEGQTFLFARTEGSVDDLDATTSTYDDAVEGTGAGGVTRTENRFQFTVSKASIGLANGTYGFTGLAYDAASGAANTSEFGGVFSFIVTPVTLVDFTARKQNDKVILNWSTATELNNDYFAVERSTDGSSYQEVGRVNGSGNSNITRQYSHTDAPPAANVYYYRLKQVDIDGKSAYSKVVSVRNLTSGTAKIYPTPFTSSLNVSFKVDKAQAIELRLYDMNGRLQVRRPLDAGAGVNSFNITDLGNLISGMYMIEIKGIGIEVRQQVMKQ